MELGSLHPLYPPQNTKPELPEFTWIVRVIKTQIRVLVTVIVLVARRVTLQAAMPVVVLQDPSLVFLRTPNMPRVL